MFHNYPRLLKFEGEKRSMDHFKSIMGEIVQQPLFINSEVLLEEIMHEESTIFHSLLRQRGIFTVLQVRVHYLFS